MIFKAVGNVLRIFLTINLIENIAMSNIPAVMQIFFSVCIGGLLNQTRTFLTFTYYHRR